MKSERTLGSIINPTNNDPAKKLTSRAVTVSTQVIAGNTTREREATSASMPRPVIHQKMSPANGQLIARQKSGSIPLGTEARCASPTKPLGMFSNAGVVRRRSAIVRGDQMIRKILLVSSVLPLPNAPLNAIKIKVMQNKKEVATLSAESSPYVPRVDEPATLPANGEQVRLEFASNKIDSSTLIIRIDTPDEQHAEVDFDLQGLR